MRRAVFEWFVLLLLAVMAWAVLIAGFLAFRMIFELIVGAVS